MSGVVAMDTENEPLTLAVVATGATHEEAVEQFRSAPLSLLGVRQEGLPVPDVRELGVWERIAA